jgi:broad specificity phosphatase PhoE
MRINRYTAGVKKLTLIFSVGLTALVILISGQVCAQNDGSKGLELFFVRHGETVANVTGQNTEANQAVFTPEGKDQVEKLTALLNGHKFDVICVSPRERTMNTILPYLKKHNMIAELWPELDEGCWQPNKNVQPTIGLAKGLPIILDEEKKRHFKFRDEGPDYFYKSGNYADDLLKIKKAHDLVIERFGQSGSSVLLVGHGLAGGRLIELFLGLEPKGEYFPGNARLWHLEQEPDGTFKLVRFNIHPSEEYCK